MAPRLWAALAGMTLTIFGVWQLESQRSGLSITPLMVGTTPATVYRRRTMDELPLSSLLTGLPVHVSLWKPMP